MIDVQSGSLVEVADIVSLRALELLEFQGDEREERLELLKDQDFWSAMQEGMSCADAWDMSERVGQCALDLITKITATGGACGGRA